MAKNRLQKIIAQAGLCSRRQAEKLVIQGLVKVNGEVVKELGSKADPTKATASMAREGELEQNPHNPQKRRRVCLSHLWYQSDLLVLRMPAGCRLQMKRRRMRQRSK